MSCENHYSNSNRLTKKAPTALVSGLEQLVEPLRLCVTGKAKDEAVAQQVCAI